MFPITCSVGATEKIRYILISIMDAMTRIKNFDHAATNIFYSSITDVNKIEDSTRYTKSKKIINCSQGKILDQPSVVKIFSVAAAAAITIGKIIGKKSTGSMISRALVFTAIAEKRDPTEENPIVAQKVMVMKRISNKLKL